jgi:hypothetical protein
VTSFPISITDSHLRSMNQPCRHCNFVECMSRKRIVVRTICYKCFHTVEEVFYMQGKFASTMCTLGRCPHGHEIRNRFIPGCSNCFVMFV